MIVQNQEDTVPCSSKEKPKDEKVYKSRLMLACLAAEKHEEEFRFFKGRPNKHLFSDQGINGSAAMGG